MEFAVETVSIRGDDFPVRKSIEAGIAGLKRVIDNCTACRRPRVLPGGARKEQPVKPTYRAAAEFCGYGATRRARRRSVCGRPDGRHENEGLHKPQRGDSRSGTGMVNFREVLTRARKGGFRCGPVAVEDPDRGDIAKVTAEERKARQIPEQIIGG